MSTNEPLAPKPKPLRDALRLFLKAASVAVVCALALFTFVTLVPEGNDYAEVSVLKHQRLNSFERPKIVIVGGSNLAYGIDSRLIEERTGMPAVNMGMNGYFGVRYMLEEVRPSLRAGDIVVIALEYDNFFKSVDGAGMDLLVVAKANPRALGYMNWAQRFSVAAAAPYVAQEKILRLLRGVAFGLRDAVSDEDDAEAALAARIEGVEMLRSFNPEGDLIGHFGMTWPYEIEDNMEPGPIDPQIIPLLRAFYTDMQARGVRVMFSYSPLLRRSYNTNHERVESVRQALASAGLPTPARPEDYVYEEPMFYDTIYHLIEEGRAMRSERLAANISAFADLGAHSEHAAHLTGERAHD